MNASRFTLPRSASRSAGFALALCLTGAGLSAAPKETDAFPTFESFIKISGKAPSVTGNPAAFADAAKSSSASRFGFGLASMTWTAPSAERRRSRRAYPDRPSAR